MDHAPSAASRRGGPPPVRKIETKGRVFLAAPRTRAVTALPEPIPHRAGRAVTTLPCLSPAAFRRPATFAEPGPRLQRQCFIVRDY
jgi:hypothetical protein